MSAADGNFESSKTSSGQCMERKGDEASGMSDANETVDDGRIAKSESESDANVAVSGPSEIKLSDHTDDNQIPQPPSSNSTAPMPITSQQGETSKTISMKTSQPKEVSVAERLSQTIAIASREMNPSQIPSGTDILALACEAVSSELAASKAAQTTTTTTTSDNLSTETEASEQTFTVYTVQPSAQGTNENVQSKSSSNKYFVEIVKEDEPNVLAELGDAETEPINQTTSESTSEFMKENSGLSKEEEMVVTMVTTDPTDIDKSPSKMIHLEQKAMVTSGPTDIDKTPSKEDVHQKHKILTRSATKTPISKNKKCQTRDEDETESPPSKKKKDEDLCERPQHIDSIRRTDKKINRDVASESRTPEISSPTAAKSGMKTQSQTNEPPGNNLMTGITSQVNHDGKQVSIPSTDELYTVELTTISTIGGIMKPMTVTVLNVAGMMFKCGKCTKPFEKQLPARTLSYFKYHNCQKEKAKLSLSESPQQKSVTSSSVTHSGSQTPISSDLKEKRPVGRPPKQARGRGRPRKIPLGGYETPSKVSTAEKDGHAKVVAKPESSVKLKTTAKETSTDVQEDKAGKDDDDDDDLEEGEIESLYSRKQQIQFIKDHYKKGTRRSSRLVKGDTPEVKSDEESRNSDDDDDGDDDYQDDGEFTDPSDPDFVKDKGMVVKVSQGQHAETDIIPDSDKKDFCIKCYLKLEHKCRMKVKVANRFKTKTCHVCNKTYKTVNSLNQHMRVHTGERPYVCNVCSKAFRRSSTLFEHMQIHNGVKKFLCSVCGRKFLRKSDHTAHMRIHSDDFNFRCEVCGKGFKGNSQLEVHMRKHTGEMPFLCTVCGHKFKHPFGLQVHMKFHEMSENPLRCTECDTVYEDLDELRMHDCPQGKQHMCTVCGKLFANHFAVKGHMKIHQRDHPSLCKSCQDTFPNEQALQIHQDENIVKCSDCGKTIKEARACMLNKLPGNSLKGKKFKCWQCHSSQCSARERTVLPQTDPATANQLEPNPHSELEEQTTVIEIEEKNETYTEVHVEVVQSDISQLHQSQRVEETIGQSVAQDIGQSVQVYHSGQPVTLHIDQSNQQTQGQSIITRMLQPSTVEVYTTAPPPQEGNPQLAAATQLGQAIQSIETVSGEHVFYETQAVYSNMVPPVQAQETVQYTTQIQQQQPVHIQQYHTDPGQQQQHVQTVYQIQPMTQQNTLPHPHQRMHQL